jgi:hypothetical protein
MSTARFFFGEFLRETFKIVRLRHRRRQKGRFYGRFRDGLHVFDAPEEPPQLSTPNFQGLLPAYPVVRSAIFTPIGCSVFVLRPAKLATRLIGRRNKHKCSDFTRNNRAYMSRRHRYYHHMFRTPGEQYCG